MKKKDNNLYNTLLDHARGLAETEGIHAINIRSIAQRAGIASGTVYNYFNGKDDILLALTEQYWREALRQLRAVISPGPFPERLEEICMFLQEQLEGSGGMLMSSLRDVESAGQKRMAGIESTLEELVLHCIEQDVTIRQAVWDHTFTKAKYARFIMRNIMTLLRTKSTDLAFLICLVKRTIYD